MECIYASRFNEGPAAAISRTDHDNLQTRSRTIADSNAERNKLTSSRRRTVARKIALRAENLFRSDNKLHAKELIFSTVPNTFSGTFDKIKEGAEANFNTFVRYRAERYKYRAHVLLAVVHNASRFRRRTRITP